MSVVAHRKNAEFTGAEHQDRDPVVTAALTIVRALRKIMVGTGRVVVWVAKAFAEARTQRAQIEIDFYRNRYRHPSKNDDDLPMVR
jgi:hypothetical protein